MKTKKATSADIDWQAHEISWENNQPFTSYDISFLDNTNHTEPQINMAKKETPKKITSKNKPAIKRGRGQPKKYTLEWCTEEVHWMYKFLTGTDTFNGVKPSGIIFINELCLMRGYSHQRWSDWYKAHGKDPDFLDGYKKVEEFLETRLVKAALSGNANPIISIFTLKNKYKWKDSQHIDHTTDGKAIVPAYDLSKLSTEELHLLNSLSLKALPPGESGNENK